MSKQRSLIFAAVYLLLVHDNQVAMIRRYNTGYQDGKYTLPSGHIDAGESGIHSVIREAKEEVGVVIDARDIQLAHVIHRNCPDRVYVDFYFLAKKWEGEPVNAEPEKCDDLAWFNLDKLPKNIIPDVKHAIERYNTDDYYSEIGW